MTGVVALHDLNPAAMSCDRVVVLRAGRVVAAGPAGEVLTEELIADVHGVRAEVTTGGDGRPHVRFPGVLRDGPGVVLSSVDG
ncbi:ABC transporter ATP-binding protein [Saccharothrix xinjiangensis]|uniref:Iron complex transport system ATP-binding protein n=1 Tax=Saccharothrix xinjiangensis TaxID=204798 RepID=A0ABV9Y700_9PSEU